MKYKALIVDDEYPARRELRYILEEVTEIEVVGEATNAKEAQQLIGALSYHVLFLDVQMPEMTGIELGAIVQRMDRPPAIVFITAHEDYAVQAFEVNAVDYILKPFTEKRVYQTVEKIKKHFNKNGSMPIPKENMDYEGTSHHIKRIPVELNEKKLLIPEEEIVYFYTEQDIVRVKTNDQDYETKFTLKQLEMRLSGEKFFRTHRAYLVNLDYVREIIPLFNGTYKLQVSDSNNSQVPVSRTQGKKLKKILGI
ncbi:DNA-binding LytR/AlgR family response regulator [Desulfitispora alkaliphila]|uniref:LytR/AlgR family response regulator transcription factor n=1 Tax=Desulfitispora alkaliphila TaxID=622674 RepID=UPI003D1D6053